MNFISGYGVPQIKDKNLTVGIRAEDLSVSLIQTEEGIPGKSSLTETSGSDNYLYVDLSDLLISVRLRPEDKRLWLLPRKEKLHLFDKSTGKRI